MESWGIHLLTFLLGAATGATGNYLASKYTDKRRDADKTNKNLNKFTDIRKQMPELISEMKEDFSNEANLCVREFFVVGKKSYSVVTEVPRFTYFEDQHHNLKGKIMILENQGYITNMTSIYKTNTSIYRISEDFWDMVQKA